LVFRRLVFRRLVFRCLVDALFFQCQQCHYWHCNETIQ
jgi:hypothetical protein